MAYHQRVIDVTFGFLTLLMNKLMQKNEHIPLIDLFPIDHFPDLINRPFRFASR